jgi:hypothetical protein
VRSDRSIAHLPTDGDEQVSAAGSIDDTNEFNRNNSRLIARTLDDSPALNEPKQDHDDGHDQQHVNEAAHRVRTDDAEQPQDDENDGDCLKHGVLFEELSDSRPDRLCTSEHVAGARGMLPWVTR